MRSIVAAAGGAPAVATRTPLRARARASAGAFAIAISTVGAAHNIEIDSDSTSAKTATGSNFRRHTWAAPAAVTVHTNVHPLAWNIGSVHRYRSVICIGRCNSVP